MKNVSLLIVILLSSFHVGYAQSEEKFLLIRHIVSPDQADSVAKYTNRYETIKTEQQFSQFYNDVMIFKEQLSRLINDTLKIIHNDSLRNQIDILFKNKIKFLNVLKNEAGEPFYLQFNNDMLLQKSNETEGKNDDAFMNIVYSVYETYGEAGKYSLPFWIHKRSYVSVSSRLGDNSNLTFYKKLKKEIPLNTLFKDQLSLIAESFKNDLTIYSAFDYKKNNVIQELQKIKNFDPTLKSDINLYINTIKTSPSFQFNCNQCNCKFEN
jgi:hypothetical protein